MCHNVSRTEREGGEVKCADCGERLGYDASDQAIKTGRSIQLEDHQNVDEVDPNIR